MGVDSALGARLVGALDDERDATGRRNRMVAEALEEACGERQVDDLAARQINGIVVDEAVDLDLEIIEGVVVAADLVGDRGVVTDDEALLQGPISAEARPMRVMSPAAGSAMDRVGKVERAIVARWRARSPWRSIVCERRSAERMSRRSEATGL